jgi:hypothetical protein
MDNTDVKIVSNIINELRSKGIPFDSCVSNHNLIIRVYFGIPSGQYRIEFCADSYTYPDAPYKIYYCGNGTTHKNVAELRFKEFCCTLNELLKSARKAESIRKNIEDFCDDINRNQIYTKKGYESE